MTDRRYQVFVSSTFTDLEKERQEVMHALLELDCIPSGMELFPAANETQWGLIQRVIKDSDYYVLIIGGRYGSIASDGTSYTEKEFDFACTLEKPILAFLHEDPGKIIADKSEKTESGRAKLLDFQNKVKDKQLCKYWNDASDLGSKVSRSLIQLIKSSPAIGWVRGDQVASQEANLEIIRLSKEVEALRGELLTNRQKAPIGSETLAQGQDLFKFTFYAEGSEDGYLGWVDLSQEASVSWNSIFSVIGPLLLKESSNDALRSVLNKWIRELLLPEKIKITGGLQKYSEFRRCAIATDHFHTILIQLRALGLIKQSDRPRSVKDTETYWCLTPYGDETLTRLRAIKKSPTC